MLKKVLLAGALFSAAFAQDMVLEEIEVEGEREVLEEEVVRELPAKDPGEALEINIPGVWKVRKGPIANDVVIRGFRKEQVNQLFDGARVYNACPNRMDPGIFHVDFEEVKEIVVIKGPFDVRNYGAVGGTVDIITKEPKKGFGGTLNLSYDSWAYVNPSLTFNYGTEDWGFLFGYSYRFSKPYEDGSGRKITEIANYAPDEISSTAFNIHTAWTKLYFKPARDIKLKVSYTHQKANDVLYPYLMMDAIYDETDRGNIELLGKNFRIQLYGSSVRHWMTNQKRNITASVDWTMGTWATSEVYGLKGEYRIGNFSFGVDTFYRNWYATTTMWNSMRSMYVSQYTIPDVDVVNVGLFGEYRKRLSPRLRLVAGLRVDYTRTEADDQKANTGLWQHYHGTADTSQTDFYPSGNIQLFYSLSGGLELFAGLGSAVRVPDPQERYFALDRMGSMEASFGDWLGNPGLDPERNTELDLGLKWQGAKHSLTFRTYFSYISNYIYPYRATAPSTGNAMNPNTQATSYTNIDAYFTGAELYGTYALTPSLFVDGSLSYVYARKKDTYPEKNINDKDIAEIPPLTSRIALRYDTGRYFGEVETLMAATQYNVDSDLNERKTSGWAVVNLKVGGTYKGFKLLAGVRNLFDKLYYTHLSYLRNPFSSGVKVPEPGRTFYLTASYSF